MTITYVSGFGVVVDDLKKQIIRDIVDEKNLRDVLDEIKRALAQVPDTRPKPPQIREERIRELAIWSLYWLNPEFRSEVGGRLPA